MKNFIKLLFRKLARLIGIEINKQHTNKDEKLLLLQGSLLTKQQSLMNSKNINDYEFTVFSQFGDDGIIQYLVHNIQIDTKAFIEFGVGNFLESNCRFLMMNNNWSGFVMDGSVDSMNQLKNQEWFWKYDLNCKAIFIDRDNINSLLKGSNYLNIGLLHIDLDGNDYHILEAINLTKLNPSILILEYNSVFGDERAITIPYDDSFDRTKAHYSNLFWGASLSALNFLANKKGYKLIGSNLAGNNAYFIKEDLLNEKIKEMSVKMAYRTSLYRESRDKNGLLSLVSGGERLDLLKGLEVQNVISNIIETL